MSEKKIDNLHEGSVFIWCLHCERTYVRGAYRKVHGLQMCPYPDCDGDTVFDAVPWGNIRGSRPEYPVIPIPGTRYPDPRGADVRMDAMEDCPEALAYFMEKIKKAKPGEVEFF